MDARVLRMLSKPALTAGGTREGPWIIGGGGSAAPKPIGGTLIMPARGGKLAGETPCGTPRGGGIIGGGGGAPCERMPIS